MNKLPASQMETEEIEALLENAGVSYKYSGHNIVCDCPKCNGKDKLSIHSENGLFQCFLCNERGGDHKLRRLWNDTYQISHVVKGPIVKIDDFDSIDLNEEQPVLTEKQPATESVIFKNHKYLFSGSERAQAALDYLQQRGISKATARQAGIGMTTHSDDGTEWLVMPAFRKWNQDGTPDFNHIAMTKKRTIPPHAKAFARVPGGESILFRMGPIDNNKAVVVCAGEIDAMSVYETGWTNVVAVTTGESSIPRAQLDELAKFNQIVILFDNDDAGHVGARKALDDLGRDKTHMFALPDEYKDANEAHVAGWLKQHLATRIAKYRKPLGNKLARPSDYFMEVWDRLETDKGISTGIQAVDDLCGKVHMGELWVVTGETGAGKSTLTSQIAYNLASAGTPVLFCPLELGVRKQSEKFLRQHLQADPTKVLASMDREKLMRDFGEAPLYMLDHFGSVELPVLENTINTAVRELGLKVVVVDHIHFGCGQGEQMMNYVVEAMELFNMLARKHDITIIVVAHPNNKTVSSASGDGRIIGFTDLKGPSALRQIPDLILSVNRPRSERRDAKADRFGRLPSLLVCLKARHTHQKEGSRQLSFLPEAETFYTVEDEKVFDKRYNAITVDCVPQIDGFKRAPEAEPVVKCYWPNGNEVEDLPHSVATKGADKAPANKKKMESVMQVQEFEQVAALEVQIDAPIANQIEEQADTQSAPSATLSETSSECTERPQTASKPKRVAKPKEAVEGAVKRGRGRPRKEALSDTDVKLMEIKRKVKEAFAGSGRGRPSLEVQAKRDAMERELMIEAGLA